ADPEKIQQVEVGVIDPFSRVGGTIRHDHVGDQLGDQGQSVTQHDVNTNTGGRSKAKLIFSCLRMRIAVYVDGGKRLPDRAVETDLNERSDPGAATHEGPLQEEVGRVPPGIVVLPCSQVAVVVQRDNGRVVANEVRRTDAEPRRHLVSDLASET